MSKIKLNMDFDGILASPEECRQHEHELSTGGAVSPTDTAEIVCISGSTRFIENIAVAAWEFEKRGILALGMHLLPAWYEGVSAHHQGEAEGVAETLDALHLRKIEMCDRLFVVNVSGYIGDSTRREIEYAKKLGKPVEYLEPHNV